MNNATIMLNDNSISRWKELFNKFNLFIKNYLTKYLKSV